MNENKNDMNVVEIFEGDRANHYENFVDTWIPNYQYFSSILPSLFRDVKEKKLLVAGCGTGNEILAFGKELSQWQITGVDPSIEMLRQAQQKLQTYPNINLRLGRVDELPEVASFSAATLFLVLHFLPDDGSKLSLLKDIHKRLQPNAPFVMLDIMGDKKQLNANLEVLLQLIPSSIDKEQKEFRKDRIKNQLHTISENRLSELLTEAGFETPTRFYQSTIYMGWIAHKK